MPYASNGVALANRTNVLYKQKRLHTVIPQTDNEWWSVKLYGNEIARIYRHISGVKKIEISHCGYQTVTTKSRLNAIIKTFCFNQVHGIYQKQGKWFIDHKQAGKQIPFETGFYQIFAD